MLTATAPAPKATSFASSSLGGKTLISAVIGRKGHNKRKESSSNYTFLFRGELLVQGVYHLFFVLPVVFGTAKSKVGWAPKKGVPLANWSNGLWLVDE